MPLSHTHTFLGCFFELAHVFGVAKPPTKQRPDGCLPNVQVVDSDTGQENPTKGGTLCWRIPLGGFDVTKYRSFEHFLRVSSQAGDWTTPHCIDHILKIISAFHFQCTDAACYLQLYSHKIEHFMSGSPPLALPFLQGFQRTPQHHCIMFLVCGCHGALWVMATRLVQQRWRFAQESCFFSSYCDDATELAIFVLEDWNHQADQRNIWGAPRVWLATDPQTT